MTERNASLNLQYSIYATTLPQAWPVVERFRLAAEAGFEGFEHEAVKEDDEVEAIGTAAAQAGMRIHSVYTPACWLHPLSSEDRTDVSKSVRAIGIALENAKRWGADTVLIVPGIVTASSSYADTYRRSQLIIRKEVLPAAEAAGVIIGVENVWNGFLLSPLEYVRYIDEFESPWIRCYLDVGNMVFGHPEHWIRIAGKRIVKLHIKDYELDVRRRRFAWRHIGRGTIDWRAVRDALVEIGFCGWATNTEPMHNDLTKIINLGPATLRAVQRRLTLRSLRRAVSRLDRHIR